MIDGRYLFAFLIVVVVVLAGWYAWKQHTGSSAAAHFSMPPIVGSPQVRQGVFAVGGAMEVAHQSLMAGYKQCPDASTKALMQNTIANLASAGQMLAAADQKYLSLTAYDKANGARTPHKLSKSYSSAYTFLTTLKPEVDKLVGWISSSKTCAAMQTAGSDLSKVSSAIGYLANFSNRFVLPA